MQPQQQQTVITTPAVIQPYVTAEVVHSYRDRQSAVIGIVLIITGSLSIIFNIADIAIGSYYNYSYYYHYSVSYRSNGVAGHGIWCGIMVSTVSESRNRWSCLS